MNLNSAYSSCSYSNFVRNLIPFLSLLQIAYSSDLIPHLWGAPPVKLSFFVLSGFLNLAVANIHDKKLDIEIIKYLYQVEKHWSTSTYPSNEREQKWTTVVRVV